MQIDGLGDGDGTPEEPKEPEEVYWTWDADQHRWVDSLAFRPKGAAKSKGKGKGKKDRGKGTCDDSNGGAKGRGAKGAIVAGKAGRDPRTGRFMGCAVCGAMDHWAREYPKLKDRRQGGPRFFNELSGDGAAPDKAADPADALDLESSLGGMLTMNADSMDIVEADGYVDAVDVQEKAVTAFGKLMASREFESSDESSGDESEDDSEEEKDPRAPGTGSQDPWAGTPGCLPPPTHVTNCKPHGSSPFTNLTGYDRDITGQTCSHLWPFNGRLHHTGNFRFRFTILLIIYTNTLKEILQFVLACIVVATKKILWLTKPVPALAIQILFAIAHCTHRLALEDPAINLFHLTFVKAMSSIIVTLSNDTV